MCLAIILSVLLQGLFVSKIGALADADKLCILDQSVCEVPNSSKYLRISAYNDSLIIHIVYPSQSFLSDRYVYYNPYGTNFTPGWGTFYRDAVGMKKYEDNDCDGESQGVAYATGVTPVPYLFCRRVGIPAIANNTWLYRCGQTWSNGYSGLPTWQTRVDEINSSNYYFYCKSRSYRSGLDVYVQASIDATTPICSTVSVSKCRVCAWPYASVPDSNLCGCKVDQTKYQSPGELQTRVALWCNTASPDGTQYYYDQSRSNFVPENGPIVGACTSMQSRKTIYMPTQKCPEGSTPYDPNTDTTFNYDFGDSLQESPGTNLDLGDTVAQNRLDSILGRLGIGDTGTHSRLDTIIDLLRNQTGGGSGGYDTSLSQKLDSLRSYLDTAGRGTYDSIQSRLGYVIDSISNDTFDIKPTIDSLMGIINTHSSRGDTSGYNNLTLDSMLNFCITMPIYDSTFCLKDTAAWPYIGPWFRWIRRMILVFWGFVCAGIFLAIAHGGNDD